MKKIIFISTTLLLLPTWLVAEEAPCECPAPVEEVPSIWTSNAEIGMVLTSGNTETETANGKVSATRNGERWVNTASLEALRSSSTDVVTDIETTTAEKYSANQQNNYKFNEFDYAFGAASYDDDRFSGYEYQATVSVGYGRNILNSEKQKLSMEAGPGMRFFKLSPDPVTGAKIPSDDEGIAHFALNYIYNFTENSFFSENIVVDAGEDVTISESVSAITTQINGKLAMKASFKIRNSSELPLGAQKKTDTETALTLVYAIK